MAVSTMRQQKLGREAIKDLTGKGKPRNKRDLLVDSGYSVSTAKASPHVIFEAPGTIKAIAVAAEQAGLSEAVADKVVHSILTNEANEPMERLKAADLAYKRQGSYAAEKSFNLTATASVDEVRTLIQSDIDRFRAIDK